MWAVEPLGNIFQQAISFYSEQRDYHKALAVECFVVTRSDPYKFVAPFKQWRLKGLLMIAKTLSNTIHMLADQHDGVPKVHAPVAAVLGSTDVPSLYHAILLMVVHYSPMAHSHEWEILKAAADMLEDIESMAGRQSESAILRDWIKSPGQAPGAAFFPADGCGAGEEACRPRSRRAPGGPGVGLREEKQNNQGFAIGL